MKKWHYLLFLLILTLGLYLRFWQIEQWLPFTWDQGRDAWQAREVLQGKLILKGPRTGIGDFYLGSAYYYLLAPFYLATNLDPSASNYFNVAVTILTFFVIFLVAKNIFSTKAAFFALFIYAFSDYVIKSNQVPWNVSLLPPVSLLIFYAIYKIYQEKYKWFIPLAALSGFLFHIHFVAIFVPPIVLLSLIFLPHKGRALGWFLVSIPFFLIWLVPSIIYDFSIYHDNFYRMRNFFNDYYIGLHWRFFLFRMRDAFIQPETLLFFAPFNKYLSIPLVFSFAVVVFLWEKRKSLKILAWTLPLWFLVPWIGFTLYGGPISDYYFIINMPIAILILAYFSEKLIDLKKLIITLALILFWSYYFVANTKNHWATSPTHGLAFQKAFVKQAIKEGLRIEYDEGNIKSYLYTIWTEDRKR